MHDRLSFVPLRSLSLAFAIVGGVPVATARAEVTVVLRRDFIDAYKDRATIDACLAIDKVMARPQLPKRGGDLLLAGRSDSIELTTVAGIVNASGAREAVRTLKEAEGEPCLEVSGAWRIWCPPGTQGLFRQGGRLRPARLPRPMHVFEIYPLSHVAEYDLEDGWHATPGYRPMGARRAFNAWQSTPCRIEPNGDQTVTMHTKPAPARPTEFIIEVLPEPRDAMVDGFALLVRVYDLQGKELVKKQRVVFVKDTLCEQTARTLEPSQRLRVIGVPRVSLKLLDWRIERRDDARDPLNWHLPYEMVVIAASPI
jgi:hypothetical protein